MHTNTKQPSVGVTTTKTTHALQHDAIARWVNEGGAGADPARPLRRIHILWGTKLNQAPLKSSVGRTRWASLKRSARNAWIALQTNIQHAFFPVPQAVLTPIPIASGRTCRPRAR